MPTAPRRRSSNLRSAATLTSAEYERAILADALATRWPRAVSGVLVLAARVDRFNRRAVVLGLPPLAADPPLAAADALWAALDSQPGGQSHG